MYYCPDIFVALSKTTEILSIAGVLAKIQTENLPTISLESYRYTNLFSEMCFFLFGN
jgi:hypothetical protein